MRTLAVMLVGVAVLAATSAPPRGLQITAEPMTPNPTLVRVVSRSNLSLVADLYWIRAIALSTRLRQPVDGLNLIRWCSFVTELDPHFLWPYVVGALLGTMTFDGRHFNLDQANALLERGIGYLPDEPRLSIYLAYNQLEAGHPEAAALTLERGSRSPRAPPFMAQLSTRLMAQVGHFEQARQFALELSGSSDPVTREFFQRRLLEIERDEGIARAQQAVDAFRAQRGRLPESLLQLSLEGFLPEVPADPLGGTLQIDAAGVVTSTSGARLKQHVAED